MASMIKKCSCDVLIITDICPDVYCRIKLYKFSTVFTIYSFDFRKGDKFCTVKDWQVVGIRTVFYLHLSAITTHNTNILKRNLLSNCR